MVDKTLIVKKPNEDTPIASDSPIAESAVPVVGAVAPGGIPSEASEEVAAEIVEEVLVDEPITEELAGEPSLLSKYFPNVVINETNRVELEEAANKLDKLLAINKELAALFSSDPRIGKAILDFKNGERFDVAINRYFDFKNIDDAGDTDLEAARNERTSNFEANEQRKSDIGANEQVSIDALQEFIKTKELDDDGAMAYKNFVIGFLDKAFAGSLTPEFFNHMYKLMDYDNETKRIADSAREEGVLDTANKKIDTFKDKEDKAIGDGLPVIDGGGANTNAKSTRQAFTPRKPFRV